MTKLGEKAYNLILDKIADKPLSEVVDEIKKIINKFQNKIEIKIYEENGKPIEVEIVAKIKI